MNLSTNYLGLELKNPIVVGSSPLTGTVEGVKACEEAGAGAVILKSLFEEQILKDVKKEESHDFYDNDPEMYAYMVSYLRGNEIELYTDLIRGAKAAVHIPIIASINCTDAGEWVNTAKIFEDAGADALELNIAISPFDRTITADEIEDKMIEILKSVKTIVKIPVSVKIGDHFTNIAHVAFRLVENGADGLVLFNRFYNSDIDVDEMKVVPGHAFSVPEENGSTLRWVSLLAAQKIPCHLAASTGIHDAKDVVKQILAGATVVQLCSVLFHKGVSVIHTILDDLNVWMQKHQFDSVQQFRGTLCNNSNVKLMERLQYLRRNNNEN